MPLQTWMRSALRSRNKPCLDPRGRIREPYLSDPWRAPLRTRNELCRGPRGRIRAPYLSDSWRIARRSERTSRGLVSRLLDSSSSCHSYNDATDKFVWESMDHHRGSDYFAWDDDAAANVDENCSED